MKPPRDGVSPLSPSTGSGGAGGLAELDNLLAMLTDTQVSDEGWFRCCLGAGRVEGEGGSFYCCLGGGRGEVVVFV